MNSLKAIFTIFFMCGIQLQAQDVERNNFNVTADVYSNYIWRGTRFGKGPHIQPGVKYEKGNFTAGVWGSFDGSGYSETDPYMFYALPFGLTLGVTDYYYPGLKLADISQEGGSHALEINGTFVKKGFSLNCNYIINEAGGAGSKGSDVYLQAGYNFDSVSIFAGAGNGWYTEDNSFNLCNIGVGTVKTIQISEKFSIPLTGQVIINPDKEQLFVVAGFSF